jgi:hypothetical protein
LGGSSKNFRPIMEVGILSAYLMEIDGEKIKRLQRVEG